MGVGWVWGRVGWAEGHDDMDVREKRLKIWQITSLRLGVGYSLPL